MTTKQTTVRVNGVDVPIEVTYQAWRRWTASEPEWEPGMPICWGETEIEAIDSLTHLLESR